MQDQKNKISVVPALVAGAAITATTVGASVDTAGYESVTFALSLGIPGDTLNGTNYYEVDLQTSDDNVTWVPALDQYVLYAIGQANGAANTGAFVLLKASPAVPTVYTVGFIGINRYVRLRSVTAGTLSVGTVMSAVAILGNARHQPAGAAQLP